MSTTKDRARAAITEMKQFGFVPSKIVAVLKELLNLYGNEWQFIEEDNYRNLIEAILASEDPENNNEASCVGQPDEKRHDMMDGPANMVERLDIGSPNQKRLQDPPSTSSDEVFLKKPKKELDLSTGYNWPNSQEISARPIEAPVNDQVEVENALDATALLYRQAREARKSAAKAVRLENGCSSKEFADHNVASSHNQIQIKPRVSSASEHSNCNGILTVGLPSRKESNSVSTVDKISSLQVSTNIPHDLTDICNGYERVKIPITSGSSRNFALPAFNYISQNTVYESACQHLCLASIRKEDCCTNCRGDCLSASLPCECAQQTGGEFAYTSEGLLTKKFIDDYLSMDRFPVQHPLGTYRSFALGSSEVGCSSTSLNGQRNSKFIKECWRKCKCSMQCGNRIVQRGITANLQVFLPADGRRWGLQSVDKLERGTFVCEYVGEVLTSSEVNERMSHSSTNCRSTYPVPLHANWGLKAKQTDEEARWLDAEYYGNVARFVSHRCHDANLVEIPVEVETPNHYYYHVALFTNRKVEALEELTLDYGIKFTNHDCLCGSKYCRDAIRPGAKGKMLA